MSHIIIFYEKKGKVLKVSLKYLCRCVNVGNQATLYQYQNKLKFNHGITTELDFVNILKLFY